MKEKRMKKILIFLAVFGLSCSVFAADKKSEFGEKNESNDESAAVRRTRILRGKIAIPDIADDEKQQMFDMFIERVTFPLRGSDIERYGFVKKLALKMNAELMIETKKEAELEGWSDSVFAEIKQTLTKKIESAQDLHNFKCGLRDATNIRTLFVEDDLKSQQR